MSHQRWFCVSVVAGVICLVLTSPAVSRAQEEDPDQVKDVEAELIRTQEKIARIQEDKGNLAAAQKAYRELLAQHPASVKYRAHVCRLAGELKQYDLQIKLARELIRQRPRELRYRLWLARALTLKKKIGEAAVHWQWIAANSPSDPESRLELASTFEALKDPARALVHYDWLIARSPKNVGYRLARLHLLGDLKKEKAQLAALHALRRLAPKDPRVLLEAADHELDQDRHHQAEVLFRRVVKLVPATPRPAPLRARALAGLVRVKKARAAAAREAREAFREAERYNDWQNDIWERGEDF